MKVTVALVAIPLVPAKTWSDTTSRLMLITCAKELPPAVSFRTARSPKRTAVSPSPRAAGTWTFRISPTISSTLE